MPRVARGTDLAEQYRQYSTQYPDREIIGGALWHQLAYTSGVTTVLTFFNVVPANVTIGNMKIPSQLPNPDAFLIRAIRVKIGVAPFLNARAATTNVCTGSVDDVAQLINTGWLILRIGDKPYADFPIWMLPAGGGYFGFFGTDGDAASPGEVVMWATNGNPDVKNVFSLGQPLFIAPQINFNCVLTWPAAVTTVNAAAVEVVLDGDYLRPVQ